MITAKEFFINEYTAAISEILEEAVNKKKISSPINDPEKWKSEAYEYLIKQDIYNWAPEYMDEEDIHELVTSREVGEIFDRAGLGPYVCLLDEGYANNIMHKLSEYFFDEVFERYVKLCEEEDYADFVE